MKLLVADFETRYGGDFTLSKMSTEQYIRDPRFYAHGCGFRGFDGSYFWVTHNELPAFFASIDWSDTAILCQHGQFESLILSHHYGVHPAMWFDTRAMGNLLLPRQKKSLSAMATFYGLPDKTVPYNLFINLDFLPPHVEKAVADGCLHDVYLNYTIFMRMLQGYGGLPPFPRSELPIIDTTIKMFGSPVLHIDAERAEALADRIALRKEAILEELALDKDVLASRECFAQLLRELDVEPPTKVSKATGEITLDFSKSSPGMKALLEHENDVISTLAAARLGVSSTIGETRARRFAATAKRANPVPVYLNYNATFSCRWSGGDSMNWQNLERLPNRGDDGDFLKGADGFVKKGELRLCIKAPPEHKLIIADSSQIEARMCAWHAGQEDLVQKFRDKGDPYSDLMTPYFGYSVSKKTPQERGIGKQLVLSCQYGSGAATIKHTAALGSYGPPVKLSDDEAEKLKQHYRRSYPAITQHWKKAEWILDMLQWKREATWGPLKIKGGRIWLPGGLWLDYTSLYADDEGQRWIVTQRGRQRVFGPKVVAHVTSAMARVVISDAMREIAPKWKIASTCHDELVCCVPEEQADECRGNLLEIMSRTPVWAAGLPVDTECEIDTVYSK